MTSLYVIWISDFVTVSSSVSLPYVTGQRYRSSHFSSDTHNRITNSTYVLRNSYMVIRLGAIHRKSQIESSTSTSSSILEVQCQVTYVWSRTATYPKNVPIIPVVIVRRNHFFNILYLILIKYPTGCNCVG